MHTPTTPSSFPHTRCESAAAYSLFLILIAPRLVHISPLDAASGRLAQFLAASVGSVGMGSGVSKTRIAAMSGLSPQLMIRLRGELIHSLRHRLLRPGEDPFCPAKFAFGGGARE